jgi:hypothetical protein
VLAFLLRGVGGAAIWVAYVLASMVISPLLFLGTALLYVDQSARSDATGRDRLRAAEPPSSGR